jgi:DNA-binding transcriptional LysR family regulator
MELYQLRCFQAVVEEGGFKRAAVRLHITQPALSYQVKQLEKELDVSLFHRRPRGASPTEAGRVLFQHAQKIMRGVHKAEHAIQELGEGVAGEIRIGTVDSVGIYFLPPVLRAVRSMYPAVCHKLLYRNSNDIMEALLSNELDLAILANPGPDRRLQQEILIEERLSLVCGRSHPFFGVPTAKTSELKGMEFAALSPGTPSGSLIRNYLARLGVNIKLVATTDNVETVKKMVETGLGIAFLPDMVTKEDIPCDKGKPAGRLWRIEVDPPLGRRIALVNWKDSSMSRATKAFIEQLRQYGHEWRACTDEKSPGINST